MSTKPTDFTSQMPEYVSHKRVRGLKIARMERVPAPQHGALDAPNHRLFFEKEEFGYLDVTDQFVKRSHCKPGGYFVRYEDGYISWSPAEAFENGYTLLDPALRELSAEDIARIVKQALSGYPKTNYEPK